MNSDTTAPQRACDPNHPESTIDSPTDRLPHEPARWFARFEIFRALGPARTLDRAFRIAAQDDGLTASRPGAAWHRAAKQWQWRQRAEAWDTETQQHLRHVDAGRALAAREQRLEMVDNLLRDTYHLLNSIDLCRLSPDQALRHLSQLRLLFLDLLAAQRSEFGHPDLQQDVEIVPFTADELAKAQRNLKEWRAANQAARLHTDQSSLLGANDDSVRAPFPSDTNFPSW